MTVFEFQARPNLRMLLTVVASQLPDTSKQYLPAISLGSSRRRWKARFLDLQYVQRWTAAESPLLLFSSDMEFDCAPNTGKPLE
jgi:hypothetical protein